MLHRDLEVAEVMLLEQRRLPQGRLDESLRRGLAVLREQSLVEGARVHADTDRGARVLGGAGDLADLAVELLDIARVHADRGAPGLHRREHVLRLEVDVCNNRDAGLARDLRQGIGVVLARHRDAHDLAARCCELGDLLQGRIDVGRQRRAHRLDADRRIAADEHRMGRVLEQDLPRLATRGEHGRGDGGHAEADRHVLSIPDRPPECCLAGER